MDPAFRRLAVRALLPALLLLTVPALATAGPGSPWDEALHLEQGGALLASAERFAQAAEADPDRSDACWRAARSYWRHAEERYLTGDPGYGRFFHLAEAWAERGLERDPECGACSLWKYAAMGRLIEERGVMWAARNVRTMSALLEHSIARSPDHRDPNGNSTLGNAHYASAVFYRMVPEWFWLPMLVGARGDTLRSLEHIEQALSISAERVDYQVEHGAILLCMGTRRGSEARIREGREVLTRSLAMPPHLDTDAIDQAYARLLIDEPSKACGFSRLGFIDVEGEGADVARDMRAGRGSGAALSIRSAEGLSAVAAPPPLP